jgi:hypothetical protein
MVAKTGDQGYFVLPNLPVDGHLQASIAAEGFGTTNAVVRLAESTTIRMECPGGIHGALVTANGTSALDGTLLTLIGPLDEPAAEERRADFFLYYRPQSRADAQGVFRFDNLRSGKYEVHIQMRADLPCAAESLPVVEVKPGLQTAISVPLVTAVRVRGRIVDKLSKQGIAGVQARFLVDSSGENARYPFLAATDNTGAQAAVLAIQAARIGYPDMVGVIDRVLATRRTPERFSVAGTAGENLAMLKFLALVDPSTAQSLLHTMEPRIDRILNASRFTSWLDAWALVDPSFPESGYDAPWPEISRIQLRCFLALIW